MQHSSCCCGHYFNCFLSVLLVHVLRAANFRFLFLLSTAVWSCRWTISSTCWIGYASNGFYFLFLLYRSIYSMCGTAPVENPIQRDQRPIPLDYYIFTWDFGTCRKVNSANFMLQSSGNLFSSSRVVACHFRRVYSDCRPFFSSNLLIHSSAVAIQNSLFFFPFIPYSLPLSWHTHSSESVVVNERLPSFCRDKSGWGYNLKANFCGNVQSNHVCVPLPWRNGKLFRHTNWTLL